MTKIGIITIHNSPNYGACLQSFALYKYIEMQKCDVELINLYRPVEFKDYKPSLKYVRCRKPQMSWKMRIKRFFHLSKENIDANSYSPLAYSKFLDFNESIKLSKAYVSIDELYANPPIYDLYITGSDQVWNPTQNYCLEPYFLTFVSKGKAKKISYASSIGINELRDNEKSDFKKWLSSYDAISIREKQGKDLLESFIGRTVTQVPDPTFLLPVEYWKSIANSSKDCDCPYILLFSLRYSPVLLNYCLKLSKESGLRLVVLGQIQPDPKDNSYIAVKDAGPKEFLGFIESADMVITDSFHSTVFSLIMGAKNFYTYISPYNKRGSRIIDLLESFNLTNHLLSTNLDQGYLELNKSELNSVEIQRVIKSNQSLAQEYLDEFIK